MSDYRKREVVSTGSKRERLLSQMLSCDDQSAAQKADNNRKLADIRLQKKALKAQLDRLDATAGQEDGPAVPALPAEVAREEEPKPVANVFGPAPDYRSR